MARTLPEQIVTVLMTLAEELADWCVEGRDASLARHEARVLGLVWKILPLLLRAVVEGATSELDPRLARARAACPDCGRKAEPHQTRRRQVLTTCGLLTLDRPWYHCRSCGRGWSVAETVLEVPRYTRVSAGLRARLVRLGATAPFRDAADLLAELTGLALSPETVRHHTLAAGRALRAAEDAAVMAVERTREAAEPVEPVAGTLLAEADGTMVRFLDGWHEVKVGLVAGWEDETVHEPSYVAAREPAEAFGGRLLTEAARRGALEVVGWEGGLRGRALAVLPPAVALGDGAAWIWTLADEHLDRRVEIVDYWHAVEHLHTLAAALYEGGEQAIAWARARAGDLLARGAEAVLAHLRDVRAPTPAAKEVLRVERGYFTKHAERMAYPLFRDDGLPLGSGAVESAAGHVVQHRMKRAGMRWSDRGGDALLALRARLRSHRPLLLPAARPAQIRPPPHSRAA
jgi:hypothetical protein